MTRTRLRRLCLALTVLAAAPYLLLKLAWLAGSDVGVAPGVDAAALHSTTMVLANVVTVGLIGVAVLLAAVLARRGGPHLPAWLLVVVGGGAAGLLAHVLVGLPVGAALQFLALGDPLVGPGGDLQPWVYAVVYPGFMLLGAALGVLLASHALERWPGVFARRPRITTAPTFVAGVVGLVPFGAAMLAWGLFGVGSTGPVGMTSVVQRVDLIVTGVLALAALAAPYAARTIGATATWTLVWLGTATAAVQGPVHLLLTAHPQPAVAALTALATPGATLYAVALLLQAGGLRDRPAPRVLANAPR